MTSRRPVLYVDARCLQDPAFQFRGVGVVVASVLQCRAASKAAGFQTVGLLDDRMLELPPALRELFDETSYCLNMGHCPAGGIFLNSSPMTHDPGKTIAFTNRRDLLSVSIIYDFIQLDWPGYFPNLSDRIDFAAKLARLKNCKLFTPISEYSAQRLRELIRPPDDCIQVIGAPVRTSLVEAASRIPARNGSQKPPYFLTVGGGDRRKNSEVAVAAIRKVRGILDADVRLKLVGHYDEAYIWDLKRAAGPDSSYLEFLSGISEATLAMAYHGALATIVPSHIEGFSLPVVEAALCGSPVIASQCAAHLELVTNPEALFSSESIDELADRVLSFYRSPELRNRVVLEQAPLRLRFRETAVCERFWSFVSDRFERAQAARATSSLSRERLPKVAFLSPFPPDQSGVARYTEKTLNAVTGKLDVDLYTQAPRPLSSERGFRDAGLVGRKPLMLPYDAVISVLGNSHFHNEIFDFFEQYGGPCILHDSRLTQITWVRLGEEKFCGLASRLLDRKIGRSDIEPWLGDRDLPTLFIEPILDRARPLIVHTKAFQKLIKQRYNFDAEVTTFGPNTVFSELELRPKQRRAARARLGLPRNTFAIATFGYAGMQKGLIACIVALEYLRAWNIPAELHLVGDATGLEKPLLDVARQFNVESAIRTYSTYVDEALYRDYLLGADAGIQLRSYGLGQPSAALVDCISAALPVVANEGLAETCDSPSYVSAIPDAVSPLLIAEALAAIYESSRGQKRDRLFEERAEYCARHSFDFYVDRLRQILSLS